MAAGKCGEVRTNGAALCIQQLAPFALPVRHHHQERPAPLPGFRPEHAHATQRGGVDPLRIVQPQDGGQHPPRTARTAEHLAQVADEFLGRVFMLGFLLAGELAIARGAVGHQAGGALGKLEDEAPEGKADVRTDGIRHLADGLAGAVRTHRARGRGARVLPRGAVAVRDGHVRAQGIARLGKPASALLDVADVGGLPAEPEPQEPRRGLRLVAVRVGIDAQRVTGRLECVGPVVDVRGVPCGIDRELLVQRLHHAALADAALGHHHRHARTARVATRGGVACSACVPQAAQPCELFGAAVETWEGGGSHSGRRAGYATRSRCVPRIVRALKDTPKRSCHHAANVQRFKNIRSPLHYPHAYHTSGTRCPHQGNWMEP